MRDHALRSCMIRFNWESVDIHPCLVTVDLVGAVVDERGSVAVFRSCLNIYQHIFMWYRKYTENPQGTELLPLVCPLLRFYHIHIVSLSYLVPDTQLCKRTLMFTDKIHCLFCLLKWFLFYYVVMEVLQWDLYHGIFWAFAGMVSAVSTISDHIDYRHDTF